MLSEQVREGCVFAAMTVVQLIWRLGFKIQDLEYGCYKYVKIRICMYIMYTYS